MSSPKEVIINGTTYHQNPEAKFSPMIDNMDTVFMDLQMSAFSKAKTICSDSGKTPRTKKETAKAADEKVKNENYINETQVFDTGPEMPLHNLINSHVIHSSTPKKFLETKIYSSHELLSSSPYSKRLLDVNMVMQERIQDMENKNKILQNATDASEEFHSCRSSPTSLEEEEDFSSRKLLNECDAQRRLNLENVMKGRIKNMQDNEKLIQESFEHLKQTRLEEANTRRFLLEQKILDDIHEREIQNKPKREAQLARENLKIAQRVLERNQRVKEAEEEARKRSEAALFKRKQLDRILEWQKEYSKEYKDMLETIKLCNNKQALIDLMNSQSKVLKMCAVSFENLIKKCKQGDITEGDTECASKLVETLKSVHNLFSNEIEKINEQLEAESRVTNEIASNQSSQVQEAPSENTSVIDSKDLSDCFDSQSLQTYVILKTYAENYERDYTDLLEDPSFKKFRFNCQKAITTPLNAISPVSSSHLADKYVKLYNLLSGRTVEVGDMRVSASEHPKGIAFCKNVLAQKFVRQGDRTVAAKPDAAFSIAAVLVNLWVEFPDFGNLVLAHFQMICPYLAPVFLPQIEGQSDKEYLESLGYQYTSSGEVEKQDSFLKRMRGIMRLYAAVLISRVRQPDKVNPLGLAEGWRWLSAILNLEPRPDICATLLYDFLEVAGNEMFRAYGAQFKKILAYICKDYFPKLEKVTPASAGGPIVRLENYLQKILKEERIPPPEGVLPPNFW